MAAWPANLCRTCRSALRIVNDTTGEILETRLRPHVGLAEGWHYAANITLPGDSPTYTAEVTTTGPLPFAGTMPAESIDGTIVTHSDLTPNLPGTLLDFATPMLLTATIHLDDIIAARIDDDGETPQRARRIPGTPQRRRPLRRLVSVPQQVAGPAVGSTRMRARGGRRRHESRLN